MAQANPYPLRVDRSVMEKFKVVAAANGRSVNKDIEMLMRQAVTAHEAANGKIHIPTPDAEDE